MKYIDADRLRKEIDHRIDILADVSIKCAKNDDMEMHNYYHGKAISLDELLSFIDSFQQEFPTTDKSVEEFLATHPKVEVPEKYKTPDWLWKKQGQPEGLHFTPLYRLIQKIPSKNWNDTVNNYAKKLRDCLIKEGYRKDAEVLQGYISYMNGNNVPMATMDEQEQSEVFDSVAFQKGVQEGRRLERDEPVTDFHDLEDEMEKFGERWPYPASFDGYDKDWVDELAEECAKHFYELGKKDMKRKMMGEAYEEEVQEVYRDDDGIHCCVSVGTDYKPGTIVYVITIPKEG